MKLTTNFALSLVCLVLVVLYVLGGPSVVDTPGVLNGDQLRLAEELKTVEKRKTQLRAELMQELARASSKVEPATTGVRAAEAGVGFMASDPRLMADAGYRKHFQVHLRDQALAKYGPFFQRQKLSPDTALKVRDALVEKVFAAIDLSHATQASGYAPASDAGALGFSRLRNEINDNFERSMRAAIGDSGYDAYRDYENSYPVRQQLSTFDAALSYTDHPLTPEQMEALVGVLAGGRRAGQDEAVIDQSDETSKKVSQVLNTVQARAFAEWSQKVNLVIAARARRNSTGVGR